MNNNLNQKKLLTPKIDVVFHSLFTKNKLELTSNFVSSLIQEKVKIIDMDKDRYLVKNYPDEKLGILDLRTELESGTLCNIEIQLSNQGNIIDRILYYWSRAFNEQLKEGGQYQELHKTIAILIADFELQEMKEIEELGLRWVIMLDSSEKRILTEKLEIRIIEIPKARRIVRKDKNNQIAQWIMFLDNPNDMEVSKIMSENKEIKQAVEELEKVSSDYELRRIAELKEKYIRDESSAKRYYKEEGMKEGLEKGLQQGLNKGMKEIISNMIKNGISKEEISTMTNISLADIERILAIK